MRAALALSLLLAAPAAEARPWVCYGATTVAEGASVIDPAPNRAGLIGECAALPYTVPAGSRLVLSTYGIEGYAAAPGAVVLAPFIGRVENDMALPSIQGGWGAGSNQFDNLTYVIPEGATLHVMLQSSQPTAVFTWFLSGDLK